MDFLDTAISQVFNSGSSDVSNAGLPLFFGNRITKNGQAINQHSALKISAYWCAVNSIAESYALLPKSVYKQTESKGKTKRERIKNHAVDYLIHECPNSKMTSSVFDNIMIVSYFNRGNAFAKIVRNNLGIVIAKEFMHPDKTTVIEHDNKLFYKYGDVTYDAVDVIHVPAFTFCGKVGISILDFAADNLGITYGAQQFHSNTFTNKGLSLGVLESDLAIKATAKQAMQSGFSAAMQSKDPYRVAMLDEGMKYKQITLTADQVKLLETQNFAVSDIARWFRIPLHKLHVKGEGGYNFIVKMSIEYLQSAIMPIADKFKKEYDRKLFTASERSQGLFVSFNYEKLLQADPESRAKYYSDLMNIKSITPNEVRIREGFNPFEVGGDEPLQMVNMQTDSQIEKTKVNE